MSMSGVTSVVLTADGRVTSTLTVQGMAFVVLSADAGAGAKVIVYDGIDATGTKIATLTAVAGDTVQLAPDDHIAINSGDIYIDVTGASAEVTVGYK
jgi:hypothetical protein